MHDATLEIRSSNAPLGELGTRAKPNGYSPYTRRELTRATVHVDDTTLALSQAQTKKIGFCFPALWRLPRRSPLIRANVPVRPSRRRNVQRGFSATHCRPLSRESILRVKWIARRVPKLPFS